MSLAAPIALFIFNRPDHLRNTIASLKACDGFGDTRIFVFGDGPRHSDEAPAVAAARAVAQEMLGPQASYEFADQNRGLSRSVIGGVDKVLSAFGRVIVLEDDLRLAPTFLSFMNAALDRYAESDTVYQVSGYAFDAPEFDTEDSVVFLPFVGTWGWGTWTRAWRKMDQAATGWQELAGDRILRKRFNLDGIYDYATMLERQMQGLRDSWGIRWYWSVFRSNGLVVYPPRSLVANEGFDGSGSHGRGMLRRFRGAPTKSGESLPLLPEPALDKGQFRAVQRAIWRQNGGAIGRAADILKRMLARP